MPKNTQSKPSKPRPDFPLTPHTSGRWCKKVRGRLHYFGRWSDPDGAMAEWLAVKDYLLAGRTPPANLDGMKVRDACNAFLTAKQARVDTGELSPLSFADYHATCATIVDSLGKDRLLDDLRPEDFQKLRTTLAKTRGAVALGNAIQRVRSVFKFAYENDLIDRPVKFGSEFKKPSRKTMRIERAKGGRGVFEAADVRAMLDHATPTLRAMICLGANCAFGNTDVGRLPLSALDLKRGWVTFARVKTGIERRCPLWPETVAAIKAALEVRPEPKDPAHAELVFITKYGASWSKPGYDNPVAKETVKLLKAIGKARIGWGFYRLRHTFRTVADAVHDQPAIDFIMGHAPEDMPSNYRHGISDERLLAVVNYVRRWLFPKAR